MKIGIDPGHGGRDPGAVGPTGIREKDVTLPISLELHRLLLAAGLEGCLTRETDTTAELAGRSGILNRQKCDLAVSVHCNASDNRSANYFAVLVVGLGGEAEKLALYVVAAIKQATGWGWGADDDGVREKDLHMLRETTMPAILVELGFISNPDQEQQLRSAAFQTLLARAIADGVLKYLGVDFRAVEIQLKDKVIRGKIIDDETWGPLRDVVETLNNEVVWQGPGKPVLIR